MPELSNAGVRIHYEVEGVGRPLVLQHGLGQSGADWADAGYVDALKDMRQLVIVDGRGHGSSDRPHDRADYTPQRQASDVVAVLDDVGVDRADYLGYSMGGHIGFALAKYAPERISSFVIGGYGPYGLPADTVAAMYAAMKDGIVALAGFFELRERLSPAMKARVLAGDVAAYKAFFTSGASFPDPLDDVPPTICVPSLLFVGEDDFALESAVKAAKEIPNAALVTLPGLDHPQGFMHAELVVPHVRAFLEDLDR